MWASEEKLQVLHQITVSPTYRGFMTTLMGKLVNYFQGKELWLDDIERATGFLQEPCQIFMNPSLFNDESSYMAKINEDSENELTLTQNDKTIVKINILNKIGQGSYGKIFLANLGEQGKTQKLL